MSGTGYERIKSVSVRPSGTVFQKGSFLRGARSGRDGPRVGVSVAHHTSLAAVTFESVGEALDVPCRPRLQRDGHPLLRLRRLQRAYEHLWGAAPGPPPPTASGPRRGGSSRHHYSANLS